MKHIKGDLIALFKEGRFDIIVHGCNCGGTMGDGIAKTIATEFPEALEVDRATRLWDRTKLGTYSKVSVFLEIPSSTPKHGVIINAYTQYHWRGKGPNGGPLCEYDALRSVFQGLKEEFGGCGRAFGVPAIGAARAGGDWNVIRGIIDEELWGEDVTFVEYFNASADPRGNYKRNMR